jgi:hypothetical protein
MRVARRVPGSQALCNFAAFKVGLEIDETKYHDRNPPRLSARAINQPVHLPDEILSEIMALSP